MSISNVLRRITFVLAFAGLGACDSDNPTSTEPEEIPQSDHRVFLISASSAGDTTNSVILAFGATPGDSINPWDELPWLTSDRQEIVEVAKPGEYVSLVMATNGVSGYYQRGSQILFTYLSEWGPPNDNVARPGISAEWSTIDLIVSKWTGVGFPEQYVVRRYSESRNIAVTYALPSDSVNAYGVQPKQRFNIRCFDEGELTFHSERGVTLIYTDRSGVISAERHAVPDVVIRCTPYENVAAAQAAAQQISR